MVGPTLLTHFDFFSGFPREQRRHLAQNAQRITVGANEIVFRAGDSADAMYLILSGQVRIYRTDDQGGEITLSTLEQNEVFGELAMLTSTTRMATAVTLAPCEFMVITRKLLEEVVKDAEPDTILKVFAVLTNQIRATNEREFQTMLSKQLLEAKIEVERQRALTQMVAGVAHEINTPLGIISTAASILDRELKAPTLTDSITDPKAKRSMEDVREAVTLITGNIQRAHRLVTEFKKVSVSQLSDHKEALNLSETVRDIVDLAQIHLKRSQIAIRIIDELPEGKRIWQGYAGYLSQIIMNLLMNAERYAYPKEVGGTVEVRLALPNPDRFELTIRDQGKGIAEADLNRIFDPFFTTGRSIGGTGLGLTIVHNLVTDAFKGTIRANSAPDKGTEFIINFPTIIPD